MNFEEAIRIIKNKLVNQNIHLYENDYDGVIVKLLKTSNTLDSGRSTKQTHIAITGRQMDIFPTIENVGYLNSEIPDTGLKKFFIGKIDVYLSQNNINYLKKDRIQNNEDVFIKTDTISLKSVRSDSTKQIQLSILDKDDKKFISFRRLLNENYILIILKRKESLEYEFYGLRPDEYSEELKKINNKFFHLNTNTIVNLTEALIKKDSEIDTDKIVFSSNFKKEESRNRIIFGAPGTGKSFKLNDDKDKLIKEGGEYERVTFHPDYSYANFVGTYKPVPVKDNEGEDSISYEYVPGPFMRIYVKAIKNCIKVSKGEEVPKPFLLLIEEINRANTAAVFGDVFQLLDRKNNASEYPIQASEDIKKYLAKEIGLSRENFNEIKIPDNMFIWATMNSADQGVMPMDTAFRRRWDFEYLGINDAADDNSNEFENYKFKINENEFVYWDNFRRALNDRLSKLNIPEDKLIGPYFISREKLENLDLINLTETVKNKVLMYLYEDAAKAYRSSLFAEGKYSTYSSLCENFEKNALNIFKDNLKVKTFELRSDVEIDDKLDNRQQKLMVAEDSSEYDV